MSAINSKGKILVIGGSGFIGRHLIEGLLDSGAEVRNLDKFKSDLIDDRLEFVEGSFTESHNLDRALQGCEVVFHLASTTIPKSSNENPLYDIETNLGGAVSLLDLSVKNRVKKVIFISSGGTVYGVPDQVPVPETHSTNPTCSYGIVKLAIEKYLLIYHKLYEIETCSLRLSNPYGEHQRVDTGQGAVAAFCHKALKGETIEIWGDGSVVRDFIYVKDAVRAMLKSIHADCAGEIINIGYGSGASLNSVLDNVELAIGCEIKRNYLSARPFDVPEIYLDIRQAKKILGWEPKVLLNDGIKLLIDSMSANK